MAKSKLISAEIISSIADINYGFISMAGVKSKEDFFNSVRDILCEYNEQSESHILDWHPVSDELDEIDYETIEPETSEDLSADLKGQIQIIQANISKKGYLTFEFDPSLGSLVMETEEVCGYESLREIKQGDDSIEYAIEDGGRPNEELLSYFAYPEDGSIKCEQVDAYFNIDPDEDPNEDTDSRLREITDRWYDDIFRK